MPTSRQIFCAAILVFATASNTPFALAQTPTPEQALQYRPAQNDVDYDSPLVADVKKCVVKIERGKGFAGFAVFDPNGQLLRRYLDTNGDRYPDQFRYFKLGVEVYRDIDANFDNKIDQSRWLNTGGTRWALDTNQDGNVDSWKYLSAEEASRVAVNAMVAGDARLLSTVLISSSDVRELGITDEFAAALLKQVQEPAAALKTVMANASVLNSKSKWSRFDAAMPGMIPADEGKASKDLTVYEGAMAIVETGGQHGFVQIGEMVKVGNVWKLTQIPRPVVGNTIQIAMGGVLMRPTAGGQPADIGTELTPEMASQIQELQKIDANPPGTNASPQEILTYLRKRRAIIIQLINKARTADERETWQRQLINLLASMAQTGDKQGLTELAAIEADIRRAAPESKLVAYAVYRQLLSQYGLDLRASQNDAKKQQQVQESWLKSVEQFVKQYPKSEDAPDGLLQLAVNRELTGSTADARRFYSQLISDYSDSPQGKRAEGAMTRLGLVGKPMPLAGKDTTGRPVSLASYSGKTVLVVFWASWSPDFVNDIPVLIGLHKQYQSKGFEIVGVNLDLKPETLRPFVTQNRISWANIHEQGVFNAPLAQKYGIIAAPTMFLVGQDQKVTASGISISELKDELRKRFD